MVRFRQVPQNVKTMTKKFFNDWKIKGIPIERISVDYSFKEKGKTYVVYSYAVDLSTIKFGSDHIIVKCKVHIYDRFYAGCEYRTVKIPRQNIITVYFKKQ